MTTDYLFLIPLTPDSASSDMRRALRKLCFAQISKLKASKKVWLLSESEVEDPDFEVVKTSGYSKEDKLFEAGFLLQKQAPQARYLVRLDDDDLINPAVFDAAAAQDFDCLYDPMHWFYDLSSGRTSAQKRAWIANTAIHRMEHALAMVPARGGSRLAAGTNFLFACDHSQAWHLYYADKNAVQTNTDHPLYLRILSPRSRSSGGSDDFENTFPFYLQRFGSWNSPFPFEEVALHPQLEALWTEREGPLREWKLPQKSFVSRFLNKMKPVK
jgi:hypothetical protein